MSNKDALRLKKILVKALDEVLSPLAPQKKGASWYMDGVENFTVLNLQKSNWGEQYYINIAAFLLA